MTRRRAAISTVPLALLVVWNLAQPLPGWLAVLMGVFLGFSVTALWTAALLNENTKTIAELRELNNDQHALYVALTDRYIQLAASARRLAGKRNLN